MQLLERYLKGVQLEGGLTLEEISKRLSGAPADLQAICTAAKRMAFNRITDSDRLPPLNWLDFERANEHVRGDMAKLDNASPTSTSFPPSLSIPSFLSSHPSICVPARLTAFCFAATFPRTSTAFLQPIWQIGEATDQSRKGEVFGEEIPGRPRMEETAGAGDDPAGGDCAVYGRTEPGRSSADQRRGPGQTGAQPEGAFLNFINWIGNVIAPVGAGGAVVGAIVSWLTGRGFGRWLFAAAALLAVSGVTRLIEFWITNGTGGVFTSASVSPPLTLTRAGSPATGPGYPVQAACPQPIRLGKLAMQTPQLLTDIANVMLLLAPSAALLCLVLAGISLRREGGVNFAIGGGFTKWMFWAVMFVTLPDCSSGSAPSACLCRFGGGIAPHGFRALKPTCRVRQNFVMASHGPVLAAFMGLRAILDVAEGENPLPSILAAFFLLGVQTTYTLIQQYNTGTQYATRCARTVFGIILRASSCPRRPGSGSSRRLSNLQWENRRCGSSPCHLLCCACRACGIVAP